MFLDVNGFAISIRCCVLTFIYRDCADAERETTTQVIITIAGLKNLSAKYGKMLIVDVIRILWMITNFEIKYSLFVNRLGQASRIFCLCLKLIAWLRLAVGAECLEKSFCIF